MKKLISTTLAAVLSLSLLLTGCGTKTEGSKTDETQNGTTTEVQASKEDAKPVELTLWQETEKAIADVISAQLKKLEPAIKVNVVRKEKVTEALKLVAADANGAPDLLWFAHDKIGLFATMGVLEPLDQYVSAEKFDNFLPMTRKAGMFKEQTYQIPAYFETLLFMYNKDLLSTPPATTDDLLAMMKEKTKDGNYGYVEQHSTAYYAAAWMNGFGGYIINGNSEPGLDKPETIDAVAYHKEFAKLMPKDGEFKTVTTLFYEKKAASTLNGPWIIPNSKQAGINLGFAAPPVINKNGKALSPFAGVQGLMMLKACKNKEAAAKVINFLTEKDLGVALAESTGAAPAHKAAYEEEKIKSNELISAMKAAAENATPMPNVPEMDVMWTVTENALVAVNKKDGDPKAEFEKAQKEALKLIEDMK
ncbi:MAG: extracellular solute-binding protein [Clostridia bacterium]|nr:extracellular solute-binding protein [Clostridia bacterium]